MSLVPLDLDRFKEWSILQVYYLLFPLMKEDFMGRGDCENVHATGNISVTVSGEPGIVTHIIEGGSDILLAAKEAEYRTLAENGQTTLQTAQETGEFTGRA